MDKVKNIIDVVNELKADASWDFCYAYVGIYESCLNANKLQFTQNTVDNNMWKLVCTYDEFNKCVEELSTNFGTSESYDKYQIDYMVSKHVDTKPVYTQEMADNGVLPAVGMECQTSTGVVTVKYAGKKVFVIECSDNFESTMSIKGALHSLKPLTPAIELIDGKAYSFTHCDEFNVNGIYSVLSNKFTILNGTCGMDYCTNIKLLTV